MQITFRRVYSEYLHLEIALVLNGDSRDVHLHLKGERIPNVHLGAGDGLRGDLGHAELHVRGGIAKLC